MTPLLRHNDPVFINFRDYSFEEPNHHGYRWIDINRFALAELSTDRPIIEALIADEQFRNGYIGAGVEPEGTIHGPYVLDRITPEVYEQVDAATAVAALNNWVTIFGSAPKTLANMLEQEMYLHVRLADSIYRLTELDESALPEYGRILGDYHEFLTINRTTASVALIVASDD